MTNVRSDDMILLDKNDRICAGYMDTMGGIDMQEQENTRMNRLNATESFSPDEWNDHSNG